MGMPAVLSGTSMCRFDGRSSGHPALRGWMASLGLFDWKQVCHLKMKAGPINIIGEHLLLVTTQGEQERPPIHQPHRREWVRGGLHPPSLTPGCWSMFGPGTCL
ncbi:hypothetical protein NQZ68_015688 [Dissostichus eleginoides]|nr:hypothetical protein NQZ68_015688 [Dissostichus eleginoides]